MHPHLFRRSQDLAYYTDLYWSGVGPEHQRASWLLIDLLDAYQPRGQTRFTAANGFNFRQATHRIPERTYATMPAAKRAARAWFLSWLASTGGPIEWSVADSGVHFLATADGLEIGSYYHCTTPGRWHVGFQANFGMTYFDRRAITTPDQAKKAIAETWEEWIRRSRARFLINPKSSTVEVQ